MQGTACTGRHRSWLLSLGRRPGMTAPRGIPAPKPRHGGCRPTIHGLRSRCIVRRRATITAPFGVETGSLRVMAGVDPPSTACVADLGKDVDGLPAQAMTVRVGHVPNGAVIVTRRLTWRTGACTHLGIRVGMENNIPSPLAGGGRGRGDMAWIVPESSPPPQPRSASRPKPARGGGGFLPRGHLRPRPQAGTSTRTSSAVSTAVMARSVSPEIATPSRVPTTIWFTETDPVAGTR